MLLSVNRLKTHFTTPDGVIRAVDDVSFKVDKGKVMGLVGESGCGKSMTALSLMRLVPPPGRIVSGEMFFDGHDLLKLNSEEIRKLRGNRMAMVFQDPMTSLNPVFSVGNQIAEILLVHKGLKRSEALDKAQSLLQRVGIPDPSRRIREYPHQLSGGMKQRVMIAMAIACEPALIIADEPTTALDVTIQAQILRLLRELIESSNTALILISHDLGVIAEMADEVAIMYAGKIVEYATTSAMFAEPLHPYTIGLLQSIPRGEEKKKKRLLTIQGSVPKLYELPAGCMFNPRCKYIVERCRREEPELIDVGGRHLVRCWVMLRSNEYKAMSNELLSVKDLKKHFPVDEGIFGGKKSVVHAVDGISFDLGKNEVLSLVGESGSGKSTTGRLILRLLEPTDGEITFMGEDISNAGRKRMKELRREMQIIFQDPYASLNPRMTVGEIVEEPLIVHKIGTKQERRDEVANLLQKVGLNPEVMKRYPHEFSGGQRQRIGIARAVALKPKLIVADEPVSALDVSIQAQVINLLKELQEEYHIAFLFIAHDLNIVRIISNRVAVMYLGKIVELAEVEELFKHPLHPYTQALLSAIPVPDPSRKDRKIILLEGDIPSPIDIPQGCRFHTRCPKMIPRCKEIIPTLDDFGNGHTAACIRAGEWA